MHPIADLQSTIKTLKIESRVHAHTWDAFPKTDELFLAVSVSAGTWLQSKVLQFKEHKYVDLSHWKYSTHNHAFV